MLFETTYKRNLQMWKKGQNLEDLRNWAIFLDCYVFLEAMRSASSFPAPALTKDLHSDRETEKDETLRMLFKKT
jgi:hypothetical protein